MKPRSNFLAPDSLAFALNAAAEAIAAVIGGRTPEPNFARVPVAARPAVMDLALGTLRAFGRGDFILGRLMPKPTQDAHLRGLLLAALNRLETRPQDAHTTVDQAVTVASELPGGRYTGLTNAVLRNFLRRRDELLSAAEADPVARYRHPAWWIEMLRRDHPNTWEGALLAGNQHPPMALRVNRRRADVATTQAELTAAGITTRALGDEALLLEKPQAVEKLPGFAAGRLSVQDAGAQRAAHLLDLADGQRVLDACAAPGGKTGHMLELANVDLLALEAEAARARRVTENLNRLGLRATVKVADCRELDAWWDGRPFDRILADVPCSASGVARRHADIKWLRRREDVAKFARSQAQIMDALWQAVTPGGKMLYCTCSVFSLENGVQVDAFVGRHADARRLPTGGDSLECQLLPDADHDGFYYALLEKAA